MNLYCTSGQLNGCCGSDVLVSSYESPYNGARPLQKCIEEAITPEDWDGGDGEDLPEGVVGLLLYTLTDDQDYHRQELLKAGFQSLERFYNPRSGNWVTLYGLKVNQPDDPPPKPKRARRRRAEHITARVGP